MGLSELCLLLAAGLVAGMINSVSSGGSFLTYPAMLAAGLDPLHAAATTLAALTPGNLAAIPEYWPEINRHRDKYPQLLGIVTSGGLAGIALLLLTGADAFDGLVPWLILAATVLFAISPWVTRWASYRARSLTDGAAGATLLFVLSIYLTYFGSGVGNMLLAVLTVRGFGDFLSANVAKNVAMAIGAGLATLVYSIAGLVHWEFAIPVLLTSSVGARLGSKAARTVPQSALRGLIIFFGLSVAMWQFTT